MGRIIKLTESDLKKLIKNIIEEETNKKRVQPINEGIIETLNTIINGGGGPRLTIQKYINLCKNMGSSVTPQTDRLADKLYTSLTPMTGTDESGVYKVFNSLTSFQEFCSLKKSYETSYNEPLFSALDGDFDIDNEWIQIMRPIRNLATKYYQQLQSLSNVNNDLSGMRTTTKKPKSQKAIQSFSKFPCVVNHPQSIETMDKSGGTVIKIGNEIFYSNGRKLTANKTVVSYTCKDPVFNQPKQTLTKPSSIPPLKKQLNEDEITYNYNMGIQCFLNKKGIKDNAGQPLKMDGSIGRLPNSKAAQAISKYQISIGADGDGVWGPDTMGKMPPKDKQMFKACVAEHGDLFDKGLHFLGLDEQMASAIGNAARSAAIKGGIAKQGNEIPQQLIDWLKKNNVKNGQWSQDPKNPQKIVVGYFPPSTLGYSRLATIVSIYRPSTISSGSKNGKWEFNGTTIIFK